MLTVVAHFGAKAMRQPLKERIIHLEIATLDAILGALAHRESGSPEHRGMIKASGIFSGSQFPREVQCANGAQVTAVMSLADLRPGGIGRDVPVDHTIIYRWAQKYSP